MGCYKSLISVFQDDALFYTVLGGLYGHLYGLNLEIIALFYGFLDSNIFPLLI